MHELGLVMHFIDMVEATAKANDVQKVVGVTLEVGEVSTIIPEYFRDCYKWAIKKTQYMQDCELDMVIIEGKSYCQDCKETFRTTAYGKTCPHCGSLNTYLVTGNQLTVKDIKVI